MDYDIFYMGYDIINSFSFIWRGKYMKRSSIDWGKASIWIIIIASCLGFYAFLFYMEWIEEFFGFILMCVMGYFAYMSSVLVDEQKRARRKDD